MRTSSAWQGVTQSLHPSPPLSPSPSSRFGSSGWQASGRPCAIRCTGCPPISTTQGRPPRLGTMNEESDVGYVDHARNYWILEGRVFCADTNRVKRKNLKEDRRSRHAVAFFLAWMGAHCCSNAFVSPDAELSTSHIPLDGSMGISHSPLRTCHAQGF